MRAASIGTVRWLMTSDRASACQAVVASGGWTANALVAESAAGSVGGMVASPQPSTAIAARESGIIALGWNRFMYGVLVRESGRHAFCATFGGARGIYDGTVRRR